MLIWKIFWLFTRVSIFSWGGGPASLALMQREAVGAVWTPPGAAAAVPWVTPEEFADAVAVGNALPGPIAPQVSAYIGYKLSGVPGAVAAAAGTVLPTTLLMLIMVVYFFRVKESPAIASALKVVRPVVVALLLWTAYDMAYAVFGVSKQSWGSAMTIGWDKVLIVAVTFAVLTFTKINPAFIILAASIGGIIIYR
ncbi:chromate transporter [Geomesophilobacter sediminis]|uniref:Chromate transporter n=1 Tax=Geomesophilobacter sediminis TaxID=2798584 RepID=A0A8J7M105_9BACT|nr:chromate transporter [Geomesophilobacter sediminis]MBJ6726619.1 chromate transporter [Geomesophilobacter sediminis]